MRWNKRDHRWQATIKHDVMQHNLGTFEDEQEGARTLTSSAAAAADRQGARRTLKRTGAALAATELPDCQGGSIRSTARAAVCRTEIGGRSEGGGAGVPVGVAFVGVTWARQRGRWMARIRHDDGTDHHLGYFDDDQEAARALTMRQRGGCGRKARPTACCQGSTGSG